MDALGSIPYTLAVALRYRGVPLKAYQDDAFADATVADLARRITWELDPQVEDTGVAEGGKVRLSLRDGRSFDASADEVPGHPDCPMSSAAMREKFSDCLSMLPLPLPSRAGTALMDLLEKLEQADLTDLSRALRAVAGERTATAAEAAIA